MTLVNNCPYCGGKDISGLAEIRAPKTEITISKIVYLLEISSKCEGVASGVVAYTTNKVWAEQWVSYNPEHRRFIELNTEIGCADSEMMEDIDA